MSPTERWERLPVLALLAFLMSTMRLAVRQLNQLLPALAILLVASPTVRNSVLAAVGALLVVLLVITVMRYLRFKFQTSEEQIQVRQGVLQRSELVLEFDRIQQADIQQPFYLRPFGLALLKLQGAGSQANEVDLGGVPLRRARELQRLILAQSTIEPESADAAATAPQTPTADFEFRLGAAEVLRIGLMQNALLLLGVIAAVAFSNPQMQERLQEAVLEWTAQFDSTREAVLIMGGIGLAVLGLLVLGSMLYYFNQYYGYHLKRHDQRYRYTAGLLNTLSRSMKVQKLQLVVSKQGLIARLLRRRQLILHQAGGHQQAERFTIPAVTKEREAAIFTDLNIPAARWQRVHPALIPRYLMLPAALGWLVVNYWGAAAVLLLMLLARWRWWACYQWSLAQGWLAVRQGLLGQQRRFLPAAKVQGVKLTRSPWQRLLGLASLRVASAGGPLTLSCLPEIEARALQQQLISTAAVERRRWM